MVLAACRAGIVGYYFPSSVIRGMLTAIGLILILKQIPHALGYDADFEGDESFLQANAENTFSAIVNAAAPHRAGGRAPERRRPGDARGLGPHAAEAAPAASGAAGRGSARHRGQLAAAAAAIPACSSAPSTWWACRCRGRSPTSARCSRRRTGRALLRLDAWRIAFTLAIVASLETLLTPRRHRSHGPYKREAPTDASWPSGGRQHRGGHARRPAGHRRHGAQRGQRRRRRADQGLDHPARAC